MAVFTQVSEAEAGKLLKALQLGSLHALRGIEGGIENTNYFVTCDAGEFVLTLFERLTAEQLPFYLHLMKHLALMAAAEQAEVALQAERLEKKRNRRGRSSRDAQPDGDTSGESEGDSDSEGGGGEA